MQAVTVLVFTLLVAAGSFVAGCLGALTGMGGGVVVVPLLTLAFGVDIHYAIGASLVSVIATSSGSAAAYVRDGYVNVRIGVLLEIATTLGALLGGILVALLAANVVSIIFGIVLVASALSAARVSPAGQRGPSSPLARRLRLEGQLPAHVGGDTYAVRAVPGGFAVMFLAGTLSSLLGIGSGALKVLALDQVMHLPFKVSTTTSNFMIGVTAAAGAGVYLSHGYIETALAMPVMLGVLAGSVVGARVLVRAPSVWLKRGFIVVLLIIAVQMLLQGLEAGHG